MIFWIIFLVLVAGLCILWLIKGDGEILTIPILFLVISIFVLIFTFVFGFEHINISARYAYDDLSPIICESGCNAEEAQKIIDAENRNNWIQNAQAMREQWGWFSMYPESVLELELIEMPE